MIKEKKFDMAANIQIIPINPMLKNGSALLRFQKNGISCDIFTHKVYIFDNRFKTRQVLYGKPSLNMEEKTNKIQELLVKAVNCPARVIIKERILRPKKGKCVKISYISLFDTEAESPGAVLCDISKYHLHYLNDKKINWKWESEKQDVWDLVLYSRNGN